MWKIWLAKIGRFNNDRVTEKTVRQKMNNNTFFMKLKHTKVATLAATLITFGSLAGGANGAILINDEGGGTYQAVINPITISITNTVGDVGFLVFEDYFTSNSTSSGNAINPTNMTISINGGPAVNLSQSSFTGKISSTFSSFDQNDLFFDFNNGASRQSLIAGDIVEIGGDFRFSGISDGVASSATSVTAYLVNGSSSIAGSTTVNISSVPEPSSALLLGLGALGIVARRKGTS